mmetsp:Transcript_98541/g.226437  ORF Transcript_98541/g.226437 Transcript_98541/m.226437 type:complete len:84 (-) Transcript_98541:605-856(-)
MLEGEQEMVACDERQGEEDEEEEYGESADESQHRPPSRDWEGRGAVCAMSLCVVSTVGALQGGQGITPRNVVRGVKAVLLTVW